jgi:hypothetical protein
VFGVDISPHRMVHLGGNQDKLLRNDMRFAGMNFLQKNILE